MLLMIIKAKKQFRALFLWWRMAIFAGAHGEFCQNLPEPVFLKKKKKKKKKSSTNVLGVVLRYLLTKIFLAAKSAARNNNSQD